MAKLSSILSEFETAEQAEAYGQWLHNKVAMAIADERPGMSQSEVDARLKAIIDARRNA